jgi:hypothetical protein
LGAVDLTIGERRTAEGGLNRPRSQLEDGDDRSLRRTRPHARPPEAPRSAEVAQPPDPRGSEVSRPPDVPRGSEVSRPPDVPRGSDVPRPPDVLRPPDVPRVPGANAPRRPEVPANTLELGDRLGERVRAGRSTLGRFEEQVAGHLLRASDVSKSRLASSVALRAAIVSPTSKTRFVPTRKSLRQRIEGDRFVDSTLAPDDRAQGRLLAQVDAARSGIRRYQGAGRGSLQVSLGRVPESSLPGLKRRDDSLVIAGPVLFALLKRRYSTAPCRAVPSPQRQALIEGLRACIVEGS